MSKRLEYKVVSATTEDLETVLNIYAQDGFRAVHFFGPNVENELSIVMSRKQKHGKRHHEVFEPEQDDD